MDEELDIWTVEVTADTSELRRELANATAYGRQFGRSLASAFEGVAVRGKSLGDVFRSLALSLSKMVLQAAFKPMGGLFAGLFEGVGFARGGVLQSGMPVPFAAGGVIASPITFPLADGRTGLAGERGAEAILPLARGPDGRLGVQANAGGSGIAVTFNVTTPDAESFRRSETQIAAMLARAVAHGQRNL
jgi:phage-related minor tail protein